jgi:uncharacterized protein (DUF2147 family)
MRKIFIIAFLIPGISAMAQQFLGKWKTIDDHSGKEKSIVEIFERGGKTYGKVIRIFPAADEDPDPICDQCPADDDRYRRKIIGMEIIRNMTGSGTALSGGDILDPETGQVYRCKLWMEGASLKVRGYWGPFYRTQTWLRAD